MAGCTQAFGCSTGPKKGLSVCRSGSKYRKINRDIILTVLCPKGVGNSRVLGVVFLQWTLVCSNIQMEHVKGSFFQQINPTAAIGEGAPRQCWASAWAAKSSKTLSSWRKRTAGRKWWNGEVTLNFKISGKFGKMEKQGQQTLLDVYLENLSSQWILIVLVAPEFSCLIVLVHASFRVVIHFDFLRTATATQCLQKLFGVYVCAILLYARNASVGWGRLGRLGKESLWHWLCAFVGTACWLGGVMKLRGRCWISCWFVVERGRRCIFGTLGHAKQQIVNFLQIQ